MATKKPAAKKTTAKKKKDNLEVDTASSSEWPKVTVGSHLTVTTYEDGRTELEWDDDALMRDVKEAIASVQVETEDQFARRNGLEL
jgi:hypothetical protein